MMNPLRTTSDYPKIPPAYRLEAKMTTTSDYDCYDSNSASKDRRQQSRHGPAEAGQEQGVE